MSEQPPKRAAEPIFKLPSAIVNLLLLMGAVFAVSAFGYPTLFIWIVENLGFVPARYVPGGNDSSLGVFALIWPFFTHLFVHGGGAHIIFNSLWLMAMGTPLARRMGTWPFLAFYFTCGIFAALSHLVLHFGEAIPVVGASGAVAGCMGAASRLIFAPSAQFFVVRGVSLGQISPILDRRVLTFSIAWIAINLIFGTGIVPMPGAEGAAIAWEAHIGGYLAGLFLFPLFDRFSYGAHDLFKGFQQGPGA